MKYALAVGPAERDALMAMCGGCEATLEDIADECGLVDPQNKTSRARRIAENLGGKGLLETTPAGYKLTHHGERLADLLIDLMVAHPEEP